jgi:hypothetical protein
MEEVRGKHVAPAIDQLSFNCPHCHALARQFWFSVHADPLKADEKPFVFSAETLKTLTLNDGDEYERDRKLKWAERMASGRPFLEVHREFRNRDISNVSISYCFSCNEIGLWVGDQLVWPKGATSPEPKLDALPDVPQENENVNQTLDASPRGAAVLLRLATEKLCKELGETEQGPRPTIASPLQEEVDARVLKALEAIRIIESNAMPPDYVGVRDDRATAETLSGLVNLICEKMMIEPRHLQALYTRVREGAQSAIEQRANGGGE